MNKDSAIPQGTPLRHTIPVDVDHSNMVKFAEDDPVYRFIMSFLLELSTDTNDQIGGHNNAAYPQVSQALQQRAQAPAKRSISNIPFSKDPNFVGREDTLQQLESELADPKSQLWASLCGLGGIGYGEDLFLLFILFLEGLVNCSGQEVANRHRILVSAKSTISSNIDLLGSCK